MVQRATNYYDDLFVRLIGDGVSQGSAIERVATAYFDGKPLPVGKKKLTKKERDSLFWSSNVVQECPPESWNAEAMSFALARYLGQEPVAADGLVARVARDAPDALIRAVRYSGLVLNPHSPRLAELDQAASESEAVAELCVDFAELKDSLMPDSKKRSERRKAQLAMVGAVLAVVVATGSIIGGCVSVATRVAQHVRVEVSR